MKRWLQVGFLILCLMACGCSINDPRKTAQTDISLTIENSRLTPGRWIVPAGEMIHLSIQNPQGDLHDLVILKGEALGETDPNISQNQYWVYSLQNKLTNVFFKAPASPGEYRIVCSLDGHEAKGEQGILVVVIP